MTWLGEYADLVTQLDTLAGAAEQQRVTIPPLEEDVRAWEEFATKLVNAWPQLRDAINDLTAQVEGEQYMKKWVRAERDVLTARLAAAEQRAVTAETDAKRMAAWIATLDLEDDADGYGPERYDLLAEHDAVAQRPPDTTP